MQQQYWPGTRIPKSRGNAFDWRGKGSEIFQTQSFRNSIAAAAGVEKSREKTRAFTIYTKARASK